MEYWLSGFTLGPIQNIHMREVLWDSWAWGLEPSLGAITLEKFYCSHKIQGSISKI